MTFLKNVMRNNCTSVFAYGLFSNVI